MEIVATHTFDTKIANIWKMFTTPESHLEKFTFMGHRDVTLVEHTKEADESTFVISRLVDTELPGFAKKVMKPTNLVVSTDTWTDNKDGTYGGVFSATTEGAPIKVSGKTLVEPIDKKSCLYSVTVNVEVKIPLIGGKIANWAKGGVEQQFVKEFEAAENWLAKNT